MDDACNVHHADQCLPILMSLALARSGLGSHRIRRDGEGVNQEVRRSLHPVRQGQRSGQEEDHRDRREGGDDVQAGGWVGGGG